MWPAEEQAEPMLLATDAMDGIADMVAFAKQIGILLLIVVGFLVGWAVIRSAKRESPPASGGEQKPPPPGAKGLT